MDDHKPLEVMTYSKSNELVSAKFKSSLLENQLLAICLTRIESTIKDDKSVLRARLYPGELKRLIGDPTHIYTRLKRVSKSMTGHSIVVEDGQGNFKAFAMVTNASYINGVFEITLNEEIRPHILGLEKRFTTLALSVSISFKRDSSFRIYEILKSHAYKTNSEGKVSVEYGVAELRFMIGLADADDASISALRIRMGNDVDWDLLYEKLDDRGKVYKRWSELERNVLRPAQEEFERLADIRFDYEPFREGRFISRIVFTIYPNKPSGEKIIDEKKAYLDEKKKLDRQREMPRDLPQYEWLYEKYVGHNNLIPEDIDLLMYKAKYNADLVSQSIEMADNQQQIDNYMGWLIRCIENGGYKLTGTLNGDNEQYEKIKVINEEYQEVKDEIAPKLWNKIKTFEQFQDFSDYMYINGVPVETLETIYSAKELITMYTEYNKTHKVEI